MTDDNPHFIKGPPDGPAEVPGPVMPFPGTDSWSGPRCHCGHPLIGGRCIGTGNRVDPIADLEDDAQPVPPQGA